MSEKRFECVFVEDEFGGTYRRLKDNETNITYMTCDVADLLNFQNTGINILKEENEQLRQMIKKYIFGRYVEGSLADLKFKAIAYEDIIKLEMSNESELKVIVICKQGKKENVKSFCQMFIPFGIAYEIKEVIE